MKKLITLTTLICCLAINVSFAQEGTDKTEVKKPGSGVEARVEMMSTIMLQMFNKVGLSEEQKQQVESIVNNYVPKLVTSRDETDKLLDQDQMRLFNKARNRAKKAGYDDDKADDYALKKLKLEAAVAAKFKKTKNMVVDLNNSMNKEIAAVLTDEQKSKLPLFGGKTGKKPARGSAAKGSATKAGDSKTSAEGDTKKNGN